MHLLQNKTREFAINEMADLDIEDVYLYMDDKFIEELKEKIRENKKLKNYL